MRFSSVDPLKHTRLPMFVMILFEPSDEGGFTVSVPALPGCISEGDTRDERGRISGRRDRALSRTGRRADRAPRRVRGRDRGVNRTRLA